MAPRQRRPWHTQGEKNKHQLPKKYLEGETSQFRLGRVPTHTHNVPAPLIFRKRTFFPNRLLHILNGKLLFSLPLESNNIRSSKFPSSSSSSYFLNPFARFSGRRIRERERVQEVAPRVEGGRSSAIFSRCRKTRLLSLFVY